MAPTGWNTREQIRDHKLAASIINGHGTENDGVLDDNELALLKRFCIDPSPATRTQMIQEHNLQEFATKGSLASHLIVTQGTENPAFDARDMEMLKEWFEKGAPVGQSVAR